MVEQVVEPGGGHGPEGGFDVVLRPLPQGARAAQAGFAGRGDDDQALPGVITAALFKPAGGEQRFEVAGERGAVHAERLCKLAQLPRFGGATQDGVRVEAESGGGEVGVIDLREPACGAAQAEAGTGALGQRVHGRGPGWGLDDTCICT